MNEAIPIDQYRDKYPKYSQLRNSVRESTPDRYRRIKLWVGASFVIMAFSIDGIQFILDLVGIGAFINWMVNPVVDFLFILCFWLCGVTFVRNPKRIAIMIIVAKNGMIPILNSLPELTLGVLATVLSVWAEDGGGIIGKAASAAEGGIKKAA